MQISVLAQRKGCILQREGTCQSSEMNTMENHCFCSLGRTGTGSVFSDWLQDNGISFPLLPFLWVYHSVLSRSSLSNASTNG